MRKKNSLLSRLPLVALWTALAWGQGTITGHLADPQGKVVIGAVVQLKSESGVVLQEDRSDQDGGFAFAGLAAGSYRVSASSAGLVTVQQSIDVGTAAVDLNLQFRELAAAIQRLVIHGENLEPTIDLRNGEVFHRTLFTRDDQLFHQLAAGINAGQHEGGGKSLEIRRFGFNMDHGGVNGGLKVMLDNVQQNQGTQGHGQGYLGAMKALSPELIEDVTIVNGPFNAEYGDFSGLGVVHIRQRESLPDNYTVRGQGGNYSTARGFFGWSPKPQSTDAYVAYEGSFTDGPFVNPSNYRRDNINANYTRTLSDSNKLGFRFLYGRNDFYSSGQVPLDLVNAGGLDRFDTLDATEGGKVKLGTASVYYSKTFRAGAVWKSDGFVGRSLFDLYSNFTFYLNDPVNGDAIQQHDSRLQEGANTQYQRTMVRGSMSMSTTIGANFHANQINVALYPRIGREPLGVTTRADADVTNGAGYAHQNFSFLRGRIIVGGGVRYDGFRYDVKDRLYPEFSGAQNAGRWQGKANFAATPWQSAPLTFYVNYGRGINSVDARGVVQHPEQTRLATTDFSQSGVAANFSRFSFSTDAFLIDHSNEQVYIPDDGSFEFKGPSRAYGFETKASIHLTGHLSLNGGITKVGNAFFKGGETRVYVDSAPHFVANAALTLAAWKGWSGSLRMRAINHYRLDGEDPSIAASGHTVFDMGIAKRLNRMVELNLSLDNLTSRDYYETQNYFESRTSPTAQAMYRIHATPGFRLNAVAGVTLRFGGH